jgi:hypothetical protein
MFCCIGAIVIVQHYAFLLAVLTTNVMFRIAVATDDCPAQQHHIHGASQFVELTA